MFNKIKITFILGILLTSIFISFTAQTTAKSPNCYVTFDLKWSDEDILSEPIAPRGEIVQFDVTAIINIETDRSTGAGILEAYMSAGYETLLDINITETSPWCHATLKSNLLTTNVSRREEATTTLFLYVDEDAPAYEIGVVKIRLGIRNLGLVQGGEKTFNLTFKPAFYPIIKTNLPEINTIRTRPTSQVEFPIEIENAGNADTKVFFEVSDVPDGWSATVTDYIILDKEIGTKGVAYLSVKPTHGMGYHHNEAILTVKITPAFAENESITGKSFYANFIIKNRGFSSSGAEFYFPIALIIFIVIIILIWVRIRRKKIEKNV